MIKKMELIFKDGNKIIFPKNYTVNINSNEITFIKKEEEVTVNKDRDFSFIRNKEESKGIFVTSDDVKIITERL